MTKPKGSSNSGGVSTVRDPKTGVALTVRGAGALKGKLTLRDGIDLTKPIAAQALRRDKR